MMTPSCIASWKLSSRVGCILVAGLLFAPSTRAQDPLLPEDGEREGNTMKVDTCFLKSASIKNGSGKVEVSSLNADWSWSFLSLEYQGKSYNWESASSNPFSPAREPVWNTLNTVWLTASYSNSINTRVDYAADADVFVSFEREHFGLVGNDVEGALFCSLPANWRAYGGMAIHHSPFQMDVYPLLGLMHGNEADPGWAITAGIPDTKVQYRFNPTYSLAAGLSVLNVDYYLLSVDSNDEHDRYLETSDNRLFMMLNMTTSKSLRVGVGIQYTIDNELLFYSDNQQNRTSYRLSSVPGFTLQVQYRY